MLLIVRIAIKAVNELFCTVQCILVRLCSPEQELKDEQLFEERLEYAHVHSCSGNAVLLYRGWRRHQECGTKWPAAMFICMSKLPDT